MVITSHDIATCKHLHIYEKYQCKYIFKWKSGAKQQKSLFENTLILLLVLFGPYRSLIKGRDSIIPLKGIQSRINFSQYPGGQN